MNNFKKILLFSIIILFFLFGFTYFFLSIKGKTIVISQLESLTHKKVSIGSFSVVLPLKLGIKNLDIQGLMKAEYISVSPSFLLLLSGRIGFNEVRIIKPNFTFEKFSPPPKNELVNASPEATPLASVPLASSSVAATPKKSVNRRVMLKHLNITDGTVNFFDHTAGTEGIQIIIKDIYFNLTSLYSMPRSNITNFELKGRIPWKESQEIGGIILDGWIDLFKKDMQASLKVERIDGTHLYPYYSQWVNLQKTGIEKARLNFTSNISGLNNNVTAECHLELDNLIFKERSDSEQEDKAEKAAKTVMNIIKALNQGKIVFDFTIRTKMDKPILGLNNIKEDFENKLVKSIKKERPVLGDVVMLPAALLEGTLKGAADISKAFVSGSFAVGSEIKKSLELAFKKEPKE